MKRPLLGSFFLLLGSGCSDPPTKPPPAGEVHAGPVAGGTGEILDGGSSTTRDAGDAGGCSDLVSAGALIEQTATTDAMPTGSGGDAPEGTFELTSAIVYVPLGSTVGPTGVSYKATVRVTSLHFERALHYQSSTGAAFDALVSGTLAVASPNATFNQSCPGSAQEQLTYTFTGDSLTLTNLVSKESFVFAKKL